jgi:hypothetical protein
VERRKASRLRKAGACFIRAGIPGAPYGALLPLRREQIEKQSETRAGNRRENDDAWLFDNLIGE